MSTQGSGQLPPQIAVRIAHAIEDIEAVLVGGQATNFWADTYSSSVPQLAEYGPYTSKDVDFFGRKDAAQALAKKLGGVALLPPIDRYNTPNSALVEAVVDGFHVRIDFLRGVLGVDPKNLLSVRLRVQAATDEGIEVFSLLVMHPVQCLVSRITNFYHPATKRTDDFAVRQAQASHWIVLKYIADVLEEGDHREAHRCFRALHHFLLRNEYTVTAHLDLPIDPLDILRELSRHRCLDQRYRTHLLTRMIERIERRRASYQRRSRLQELP